jgi:hypothetical protein
MTMARRDEKTGDRGRSRDLDPRTPFHKFPGDLLLSTARRLGELGFTAELADAIRRPASTEIVRQHLRDVQAVLLPERDERRREIEDIRRERPRLIRGMFAPPEQQIVNVRAWAQQYGWDLPEAWFTNLGPAPTWPDDRLQCVVLEVALPDLPETKGAEEDVIPAVPGYVRTVRDLWGIISTQHPAYWKYEQLLDADHLFLLEGATYEPGLRWRVLDLGANWDQTNGIAPATVRNPITSPNVDGFAALAHHPQYVRRMNGVKVPYAWIAGFHVSVSGRDPRRLVPNANFNRDGRQVSLGASWDDDRYQDYAVPSRRGV